MLPNATIGGGIMAHRLVGVLLYGSVTLLSFVVSLIRPDELMAQGYRSEPRYEVTGFRRRLKDSALPDQRLSERS